jgi:hypothetical protein
LKSIQLVGIFSQIVVRLRVNSVRSG